MNSPSVIRPEARASWSCASLEAKEGTGVGGKCTSWPVDDGVAGEGGSDAKGVAGGGASHSMGGDGPPYCIPRVSPRSAAVMFVSAVRRKPWGVHLPRPPGGAGTP